jgi:hypothetical protein
VGTCSPAVFSASTCQDDSDQLFGAAEETPEFAFQHLTGFTRQRVHAAADKGIEVAGNRPR